MKTALIAFVAASFAPLAMTVPMDAASAQRGGVVMDIFGDQKCPESNGEEIVVCRKLPAYEQYRIPKDLRDAAKDAPAPNWTARAESLQYVGRNGPSTCSPDGNGGETGCWSRLMNQARAERKEKKAEEDKVQAALP